MRRGNAKPCRAARTGTAADPPRERGLGPRAFRAKRRTTNRLRPLRGLSRSGSFARPCDLDQRPLELEIDREA